MLPAGEGDGDCDGRGAGRGGDGRGGDGRGGDLVVVEVGSAQIGFEAMRVLRRPGATSGRMPPTRDMVQELLPTQVLFKKVHRVGVSRE